MSMLTPSKTNKAPMNICNRCILDINNDLLNNPCNIMVGHLAKKCTKCATGRHPCVLVEQPLWDTLKQVKAARAAHATAQRDAGDQEEMDAREQRATELGQQLIDELKQYNHNRKNFAGDRAMPRKRRGGAAQAGTNDETLAELQSIRRGILALVEVGKVYLRDRACTEEDLAPINAALGPDAPEPVEEEEEGEEMEEEE